MDHTNCLYKVLIDITAVDYPEKENRFEVVYLLLIIILCKNLDCCPTSIYN